MAATDRADRPLALVMGASSGIGLELAREFVRNGFDVIVNAEDDQLRAAAASLAGDGAEVHAVQADLSTPPRAWSGPGRRWRPAAVRWTPWP